MTSQKATAASNIQRARGRQLGDQAHNLLDFGVPAGSVTVGELSSPQVPLVVLSGALIVVSRGGGVAGESRIGRGHVPSLHRRRGASPPIYAPRLCPVRAWCPL